MKTLRRVYFEKSAYVDVMAESNSEAETLAMNVPEFTYEGSYEMVDQTEEVEAENV